MRKIYFYFLLLPFYSLAQQEAYYGLYQYSLQIINPAYAASEGGLGATLLNRSQWVSLENAPKSTAFSVSSEREKNLGLGISIVSDEVFIEKQTFAYFDFSYKLDLGDDVKIYLGLKAGGNFYNSDGIGLNTNNETEDPAKKLISRFNPNIGVGTYLKGANYWFSFSMPRLFNAQRDQDRFTAAKDRVHTYFGAGTQFNLSERFILKPSIMLRKVKGLPINADLTGFISVKNRIDYGISYRTNASISYMVFVKVIKDINVGYAYETPTEQMLSGLKLKTHEIILRFRLGGTNQSEEITVSTDQ